MTESNQHMTIKKSVGIVFRILGYEVTEEFVHGSYRIDLVAEKENTKVAVEIGNCPAEKILNLEKKYNEVVHIPYETNESWFKEEENNNYIRTNVYMDEKEWEKFRDNVGARQRSKVLRKFIKLFNNFQSFSYEQ